MHPNRLLEARTIPDDLRAYYPVAGILSRWDIPAGTDPAGHAGRIWRTLRCEARRVDRTNNQSEWVSRQR